MSQDVHALSIALGDPAADNRQLFVYQAPSDGQGGGITIVEASAVNAIAVTNSLGVGGTTFTLQLLKYSNAGTPAVNGTISNIVGGTAVGWAAGVPQPFTLYPPYTFIDAGEWLVVDYQEENAGNPTGGFVTVKFKQGK